MTTFANSGGSPHRLSTHRTELRLTLMCMTVFALVLIVFAASVFYIFTNQIQNESRADLRQLADAVIASIDYDEDEDKNPASAKPDLIASAMPETSSQLLNAMKLQWFDFRGELKAAKGTFKVEAPLATSEGFAELTNPSGLMFTKPVVSDGRLLGYVRVAQPLDKQNLAITDLKHGLLLGTLAALLASGIGTAFLVRLSMNPIFKTMQQLRQFTSDASHELRNPIAAIRTNSVVALKHADGMRDGDKEKFEVIEQCGNQMQRLVESLLLLSRSENVPRTPNQANLQQVAVQSVKNLKWLSDSKSTNIEIEIAPDIVVDCDPDDLQRVIANLVENAIRYTNANGTVRLQAVSEDGRAIIKVEDNGIGIARDDIEKVYNRFWRADKVRQYDEGSEGLGLAIVKALVERYQGRIWVQSEFGKGSVFSVSLPRPRQSEKSNVSELAT